jgi:molybdenum cofactor cytidylyltransferase
VNGVAVMLADMPKIDAIVLDRLITTFCETGGDRIVVPTWQGRRGNPVVWSSRFFPELMAVTGDAGGRYVLGQEADSVIDVELGEAVGLDVDTPEALAAAGGAAGTGQPENA